MARRFDVLLHPVRLRIVTAISGEELTTAELSSRLPDIAHATLYRHVAMLIDGGVLDVISERQVRGGVERTYRLRADATHIGPEDVSHLSPEEHYQGFVTFVGTLIAAFGRYLDNPGAEPGEDGMGYRQFALWLSDAELDVVADGFRQVLEPFLDQPPAPDRTRRLFSTVLIPDLDASS